MADVRPINEVHDGDGDGEGELLCCCCCNHKDLAVSVKTVSSA